MSDKAYEEALAEIFAPWFTDGAIPAGEAVGTPKEAARKAIIAAMDAPKNTKGVIRVIADTPESKREARHFLDAMFEHPKLKIMVKKLSPDAISLHGGLRVELDLNGHRLVSNCVATIRIDPRVSDAIGFIWLDIDYDTGTIEDTAAVLAERGIDPALADRYQTFRWQTPEEAKFAPKPHWDEPQAGPPADNAQHGADDAQHGVHGAPPAPDPVQERLDKADRDREAQKKYDEAREQRRRDEINEKLRAGYRRMGGVA
jgi:hypothetical protein